MTLYLVDASGLVHRAFHAIRGLTNRQGVPTNAIFGLASMLKKFRADSRPSHCAVVLDAGRETFRNELFTAYKANRPETDPDLAVQFPYVPKLASAMGFNVLSATGFEADDIIATLAGQATAAGWNVVVVSGDKDLFQLVGNQVSVYDPMKDKTYDRQAVFEKMGVFPEFIRDYLALVGDSSDNVPGVAGIGAKGAAELINTFGNLESIIAAVDGLPNRARTAVAAGIDSARLSYRLVTLHNAVPLPVAIEDLAVKEPDRELLAALYRELDFRKLLAELGYGSTSSAARSVDDGASGKAVTPKGEAPQELDMFASEPALSATAAIEKTTLSTVRPRLVSGAEVGPAIDSVSGRHLYVAFSDRPDTITALLADDGQCIVFGLDEALAVCPQAVAAAFSQWSGAGFKQLTRTMLPSKLSPCEPLFDPCLAEYVINAGLDSYEPGSIVAEILGRPWPDLPDDGDSTEAMAARAATMRDFCMAERERFDAVSNPTLDRLLKEVEIPLAGLLGRMEHKGIMVDRDVLEGLSRSLGDDLRVVEKQIIDAAGVPFNPASPKQLADVLFSKLKLPIQKKKASGPSTDVKVLEELAPLHPVPALVLEYRSLAKLKGTYADALHDLIDPADGRIHTTFNQTVTATGRLSSSDPNLQNIPIRTAAGRKIRHAFRAPPGRTFVSADYSQIELRVLAHFAADPFLAAAFRDGRDIHSETAGRIYGVESSAVTSEMRRVAKIVNFGLLYGMGPFRLAGDLKIPQKDARKLIDDYFAAFPGIRAFMTKAVEDTRATGYSTTLFGRRRGIPDINSTNHQIRAAAERIALNMPVQGTAADIVKIAMVRLDNRLKSESVKADIVLQVHDELVLECDCDCVEQVKRALVEEMANAADLIVPLVAEPGTGTYWDELH